jgi:hypothetical protein
MTVRYCADGIIEAKKPFRPASAAAYTGPDRAPFHSISRKTCPPRPVTIESDAHRAPPKLHELEILLTAVLGNVKVMA